MSTDTPKYPWEDRLREAARHAEEDLNKLVAFINDEVVPDIRRNGSDALRSAAAELERLARTMDDSTRTPPRPPAGAPPVA